MAAKTMDEPLRWPLVNTLGSRDGTFTKDSRIINGYAEKQPAGDYNVEKRPGFGLTPEIAGFGLAGGLFTYPQVNLGGSYPNLGTTYNTVLVSGGTAYFVYTDATGTQHPPIPLGSAFSSSGNKMQFTGIPGSPTSIIFNGNNTTDLIGFGGYAYVVQGGVMTPLQGGGASGYPANTVPGIAYLNGYAYVMDYLGAIWQTATQNNVLTWSGNQVTAGTEADLGVVLAKQIIYVVAIKTWSTQFFYDAGNTTGSSLAPLPGALFNFGCISADTFAELDGVFFWATQSKEGTYSIVMVDDLNPKFISTPAVERQLDLASQGSFYAIAYQHAGHKWYVLTNVTNNITMVYDVNQGLWYKWTDYQGNYYPVAARAVDPDGNEWHQMINTGSVYEMKGDYLYPNDYGNIVPVDIYTPNFDGDVDRIKYLPMMRFNADQTNGSELYVRCSDDDYQSWTNFRKVDLSKKRPILTDCGSFYRRALHLRHRANTGFRIKSIDLQMGLGTL
jgi:hypothetical protein